MRSVIGLTIILVLFAGIVNAQEPSPYPWLVPMPHLNNPQQPQEPTPFQFPPLQPYSPNIYGPGVNSDATGRPFTWQPLPGFGAPDPFSQVQPNVYGPGIGMDQYGRPVTPR